MPELPSLYQQQIHVRHYARWSDELGRRETWDETVDRFMQQAVRQTQKYGSDLTLAERAELRDAIARCRAMPSMRALMTAGPALERDNVAGYNCFAADEKFLTDQGEMTFVEASGTIQNVLNAKGDWTPAEIKSFGQQPLVRITFRPGERSRTRIRHTIEATPNHRWITENRGEVTDLREGDLVRFNSPGFAVDTEAFIRGFGFGDGTIDARGRARVRLCGEKDLEFIRYFEEYGHCSISYPEYMHGDALVLFHKGYFEDWKELPTGAESSAWLGSWFIGYLAADGCLREEQPMLCSQNPDAIEFAKSVAPYAGYIVTGQNTDPVTETNFGKRAMPLQRLTVRREGIFRVMSVDDLGVTDEVYCAVEPRDHTFTLANGILTGNCAYVACDHPRVFDETLFILCCGTGVGFSVEQEHITKLPEVPWNLGDMLDGPRIVVGDSKEGWALAYRELISHLYAGVIPKWDVSNVRPAGARLKTFGGRASGPEPLVSLFEFTVEKFLDARDRKLTSAECHEIMCKIGDIVVVGGVRRSAMISLYDPWDDEMVHIKDGAYWERAPHLRLANNSGVWSDKPDWDTFLKQQWEPLRNGKSGEPGLVNRAAFKRKVAENGRRDPNYEFGCNPCGEIILRSMEFCNLTEIVARPEDEFEDLINKARLATILGVIQSTLTDFRYIRDEWRKNCEEERLLGVSITGVVDNELLNGKRGIADLRAILHALKHVVNDTAEEWSKRLGINMPTGTTCNKPSGTVAKLVLSGAGINEWHSPFFIQRQRGHKNDPAVQVMQIAGVPNEPDLMDPDNTVVFSFPIAAPDGALTRDDMPALRKLELWLAYAEEWCEHNPSVTINVKDHEWDEVGEFVYEHFDRMAGIAFLPYDNHVYPQAPYEAIDAARFEEELAAMPDEVPWEWLSVLENDDHTEGTKELACMAGSCAV